MKRNLCTLVTAINRFNSYIERERQSMGSELISLKDHLVDVTQCQQFFVFLILQTKRPHRSISHRLSGNASSAIEDTRL